MTQSSSLTPRPVLSAETRSAGLRQVSTCAGFLTRSRLPEYFVFFLLTVPADVIHAVENVATSEPGDIPEEFLDRVGRTLIVIDRVLSGPEKKQAISSLVRITMGAVA